MPSSAKEGCRREYAVPLRQHDTAAFIKTYTLAQPKAIMQQRSALMYASPSPKMSENIPHSTGMPGIIFAVG